MATERLECVEVNPEAAPAASVIWLHGLGADGHDFEAIVPELRMPEALPVRFVFPHAPMRPVTINAGMVMRAWFDILDISTSRTVNMDDFRKSVGHLEALIEREIERGVASEHIVLAGFSQGGSVALHAGLCHPRPLAGILALSTYLPTADALARERSEANRQVPILMAHGTMDPMVSVAYARSGRDALVDGGYPVRWKTYPMQHAVCAEEIRDIRDWLCEVLG